MHSHIPLRVTMTAKLLGGLIKPDMRRTIRHMPGIAFFFYIDSLARFEVDTFQSKMANFRQSRSLFYNLLETLEHGMIAVFIPLPDRNIDGDIGFLATIKDFRFKPNSAEILYLAMNFQK